MKMYSKLLITLLFSAFPTLTFAQTFPTSQAVVLGCGDKKIKWDVSTDRSKHPLIPPEPGKALVYFLQDDTNFLFTPRPTTRFGLNGWWVGATQANAYLYVSVDPAEQHLCASWQSWTQAGHTAAADHFLAEADKSYFFVVRNLYINVDHGPPSMKLDLINSDEGQLLISKFGCSTSRARK